MGLCFNRVYNYVDEKGYRGGMLVQCTIPIIKKGSPAVGGGNNQWNYHENAAFGMTAAGNTSNLIGPAAEYTAYEARALMQLKQYL
jgi:hypothetical protein